MKSARESVAKLAAVAALGVAGVGGLAGCQTPPAGFGGMTLPSPHYLEHPPQYFPPDPPFPLQREVDSMQNQAGITGAFGAPGVGPAPIVPVPVPVPVPVGPGVGPAGGIAPPLPGGPIPPGPG